jgi:hypothetical protein
MMVSLKWLNSVEPLPLCVLQLFAIERKISLRQGHVPSVYINHRQLLQYQKNGTAPTFCNQKGTI